MKGKILDWKDDKGFGFILPENGSDKIFFHISDVKTKGRRPKAGDLVNFDITRDARQRIKAKQVAIQGLSATKRTNQSNVEPVKKTILDYLAIIVFILSIGAGGLLFYQTKDVNKLAPFGVAAVAALLLLSRQKKPKEKNFTCARCKVVAGFDKRTIQAWNKGMTKLYCSVCHQQWLSTQPEPEQFIQRSSGRSGCLGVAIALMLFPAIAFIGLFWSI